MNYQGGQYKVVACGHYGTQEVFADPHSPIRIFAGGESRGLTMIPGCLLLDLANVRPPSVVTITGVEAGILSKWTRQRRIAIDWPDYGKPLLPVAFWNDLMLYLRQIAVQEGGLDVLVACQGGHGRTGTALAILAALMEVTTTPITFVRHSYCKEAIETVLQEHYVEEITGCQEDLEPRRSNFRRDYDYWDAEEAEAEAEEATDEGSWQGQLLSATGKTRYEWTKEGWKETTIVNANANANANAKAKGAEADKPVGIVRKVGETCTIGGFIWRWTGEAWEKLCEAPKALAGTIKDRA